MKKYTVYAWIADDEGGYGICLTPKFSPKLGYRPASGWRARPSEKIGEFDTLDELADLLWKDAPDYYLSKEEAVRDAKSLWDWYNTPDDEPWYSDEEDMW